MIEWLEQLGKVLVLLGTISLLIGSIGLIRLPTFFTRLHAVSVGDGMSSLLISVGLLLHLPDWQVAVKLILILILTYVTAPVISHVLCKAALPYEADKKD